MPHQSSGSIPYNSMRRVEAAMLSLLLSEDYPWRLAELRVRLGCSADVVRICVARLRADGLLIGDDERVRASWAAIRSDELAG
jgi:DNA-binding GntR family transcriptional regulator